MASNFPASADDSTTLPNPAGTDKTNSPDHAALHGNTNDAIKAVEAKVGTGASTPTNNTFLIGNGTGTSVYSSLTSAQLAARLSDETGTGLAVFGTTPTLVTPKVDTINESTPANGVTIDGLNIKDGELTTANSLPPGAVVQVVSTNYSAVATGTTLIPEDDTIPQITEGTEFMTRTISPRSATNRLLITAKAFISQSSATNDVIGALFQDSTANALAAQDVSLGAAGGMTNLVIEHDMVAGTTSSTTFRFRAGPAVAATVTFNGFGGARKFGGITLSSIKIIEYKA
jgi:hypothetical protein